MSIIGITGTIGTGKNTLASLFEKKNYLLIDVDQIGKEILTSTQTQKDFLPIFGSSIFDTEGNIIPSALGNIVFNNNDALRQLNQYMHPKMKSSIQKIIKNNPNTSIVIHAALLFQMKLDNLCALIILMNVEEKILHQRIIDRNSYLSLNTVKRLILKQKKDNDFFKSADIIIDNSQDLAVLGRKFIRLYSQFKDNTL